MKGTISPFSLKGMVANPSVLPVVACIVLGVGMAGAYTLRLAVDNPDVSWLPKKNPLPNDKYQNREYKLYLHEPYDAKTYEHPRPRF